MHDFYLFFVFSDWSLILYFRGCNITLDPKERYFVKRKNKSLRGIGERPNRDALGGWWKANSGDNNIIDVHGLIVCYMKL